MFIPMVDPAAAAKCDNCEEIMNAGLLRPIKDAGMRLTAGEQIPAGECPDCGCCAFLLKDEPTRQIHPELTTCEQCGDPIYMDTIFDAPNDVCARCVDYDAGLDAVKQEAYVTGFVDGRRQRRMDEHEKALEFADLVAHRIRSWTGDDDDAEILDLIEADARRLGVMK